MPGPRTWTSSAPDPFLAAVARRDSAGASRARSTRPPKDLDARRVHVLREEERIAAGLDAPLPAATAEHEVETAGQPAARVRVYWPSARRPTARTKTLLPMALHLPDGGWELDAVALPSWDRFHRALARAAGAIVIAGQPSLAPEARFPVQPEQAWGMLRWAVENARELGGDPQALSIAGTGAGANLAAAAAVLNRRRGNTAVRAQLLIDPELDLAMQVRGRMPRRDRRKARTRIRQYVGPVYETLGDPLVSPLRAEEFYGLPPALILSGERDPRAADGDAYVRALAASGVPAVALRYTGVDGGLARAIGRAPAADRLLEQLAAAIATPSREYRDPRE